MAHRKSPIPRLLLLAAGGVLAAALMVRLAPTESPLAAFALWTLLFAALLAPAGICRRALLWLRVPRA